MIRFFNPCFILCLTIVLSPYLISAEDTPSGVYPGDVFYITPSFSSAYLLSGSDAAGGELRAGLQCSQLVDSYIFGMEGGYGFLDEKGEDPRPFSMITLKGAYRYTPFFLFSVDPFLSLSLLNLSVPALSLGSSLNFHITDRNFLSLDLAVQIPFSTVKPHFSLGIGIKHRIPVLRKFPPLNAEVELSTTVFSPDGDGVNDTLDIALQTKNGSSCREWTVEIRDHHQNPVKTWSGKGEPPGEIRWDGYSSENSMVFSASDYYLEIRMTDKLGNRLSDTAEFVTDVFVENVGGQLRIRIPGIQFSPGAADFSLLSREEIDKNREKIARLSTILDKFPDYRIMIEGHGNLIYWASKEKAQKEQEDVLIPLSRARAMQIKRVLIEEGIDPDRLDVSGKGGESPLVPFSDEQNRWKNRRVEFILLR